MARTTHRLLLSVTSNSWSLGALVDKCIHQMTEQTHYILIIFLFVLMFTVSSASLSCCILAFEHPFWEGSDLH